MKEEGYWIAEHSNVELTWSRQLESHASLKERKNTVETMCRTKKWREYISIQSIQSCIMSKESRDKLGPLPFDGWAS